MIDASTIAIKSRIASEIPQQLAKAGVPLSGKTLLDVGSGLGYNAKEMSDAGADVHTIEPDSVASEHSKNAGLINPENHTEKTLEEAPELQLGKFDLATTFLWNINAGSYHPFLTALAKSIKPDSGKAVIGIHDDLYMNDPYGLAVAPRTKKYFDNVQVVNTDSAYNRQLLILSKPKQSVIDSTTV